jgi:hypothetical protein
MKAKTYQLAGTAVLMILASTNLPAQTVETIAETTPTIVERGPHHRVWESAVDVPVGKRMIKQIHRYTEMASGMHYSDPNAPGQWLECKEVIDIVNGFGVATQGQVQVIFSPNLNTSGAIDAVTPDGRFSSTVLGLAYTDISGKSVLIAEVTNSIGQLVADNQVIYPGALVGDGVKADVRYTYRRGSFEQEVLLRSQIPPPSVYGLDSSTARLEIWTQFFEAPNPQVATRLLAPNAGPPIADAVDQYFSDDTLDFGMIRMGPGMAFALEPDESDPFNEAQAAVGKTWTTIDQRQFLIEKVQYSAIAPQLSKLPKTASIQAPTRDPRSNHAPIREGGAAAELASVPVGDQSRNAPVLKVRLKTRREWLAGLSVPPRKKATHDLQLSAVKGKPTPGAGVSIDYSLVASQTNFTFQGDSTYVVTGPVTLSGTTVLEGGAVIKYMKGTLNGPEITVAGSLDCRTGPYRPAVLTATNDNTVGGMISTNANPGTNHFGVYLNFSGNTNAIDLHDVHLRYPYYGILLDSHSDLTLRHTQIQHAFGALVNNGGTARLRNVLINDGDYAFAVSNGKYAGEQVTIHHVTNLRSTSTGTSAALTNTLLISVTNFMWYTAYNVISNLDDTGIFQTVGAASHYLIDNSPYRGAGDNEAIDQVLASDLHSRTTYPPIVFPINAYLGNTNLVLAPQAQRDLYAWDLGYHYDPLDYVFGYSYCTNFTSILLTNGVAIGTFAPASGSGGILLDTGATFTSEGSPTNLNRIVRYNTVQEQATTNWQTYTAPSIATSSSGTPQARFRFTDWSVLASDADHFLGAQSVEFSVPFTDCQFHGGLFEFWQPSAQVTNCLFERVYVSLIDSDPMNPTFRDCTFFRGLQDFEQYTTGTWAFQDNIFDSTNLIQTANCVNDHNGYITNATRLSPNATNDVLFATNNVGYQSSWLGRYYLPTNSPFIDKGSFTNAALAGFYHYTTLTNQTKELTNRLDLGFHVVAVNTTNGVPIDTDGDGWPDYWEDFNGNGVVNSGETDWNNAGDFGLRVWITRPRNNSVLP